MSEGPSGSRDSRSRGKPAGGSGGSASGDSTAGGSSPRDGTAEPVANPELDEVGGEAADGPPDDTYALYRRGLDLLGRGSAAAAAQLLERAAVAEPESRSILEALGRAQFDTKRYEAAAGSFRRIVEASPSDDYAQFGLGLA